MEVWALERTAPRTCCRRSDGEVGRRERSQPGVRAIVKGQNLPEPGIPESFNVLVKELQALGIKVTMGQSTDGFYGTGIDTGTSENASSGNGSEE